VWRGKRFPSLQGRINGINSYYSAFRIQESEFRITQGPIPKMIVIDVKGKA
jgi:hypothetical protein